MLKLFSQYQSRLYPFLAVADQALQSVINLLTNIFLIRYATKAEYGVYGIGFTSVLLFMGLAHALFSLQMTVIAPDKPEVERHRYFGSMFISMSVVILVFSGLALSIATLAEGLIPQSYRVLIGVVALSTPGVLIMQFMRQYLYFYNMAFRVLVFDFVFLILYIGLLLILFYYQAENLHYWALLLNGGIALMIGIVAIYLNLQLKFTESLSLAKSSFIEAWHSGSWAILGSLLTVLQTQGYVYLLAIFRGPAAVAEMNAARLFLSPLLVMSSGFSKVMIPKMALLKSAGKMNSAVSLALKVMVMLIVFLCFYLVFIALSWDWLAEFMSDKGYENLWILVILWGVYFLSNSVVNAPSELLQITRKFRFLTLAGMVTAAIVLAGSIPAIIYFGAVGAVIMLILGELGLAVILWSRFETVRKDI